VKDEVGDEDDVANHTAHAIERDDALEKISTFSAEGVIDDV